MHASSLKSTFRNFCLKSTHNLLPTLSNLHKFWPQLYSDNLCPRCLGCEETTDHIWTCPFSRIAISTIFQKAPTKLYNLIIHHLSSSTNFNSHNLKNAISNFHRISHFFKSPYNSLTTPMIPGYIELFKGFVPIELTKFILNHTPLTQKLAMVVASNFISWLVEEGRAHIWNNRCLKQIQLEKQRAITPKIKKSQSTKRTGRPPNSTSQQPYNTIVKIHSDPNLCSCGFPTSAHTNDICPKEGLIKLHSILALSNHLQLKNNSDILIIKSAVV
jgi:hypothetical protein